MIYNEDWRGSQEQTALCYLETVTKVITMENWSSSSQAKAALCYLETVTKLIIIENWRGSQAKAALFQSNQGDYNGGLEG